MTRSSAPAKEHRSWTWWKRRLFPRGLKFTREGKVYVAVTLGVGFGAINTGNNLLFLVLGLMLGLIVISGILSELSLRGIEIKRKLVERVEAKSPFAVELVAINHKKWASSYGIELRDEIDGRLAKRQCFFLRVGRRETRSVTYRCRLPHRGLSHFSGTFISTKFPFGFFEKRRFQELLGEIIVIPAEVPTEMSIDAYLRGIGTQIALQAGWSHEFRELRSWTPGDDPRRIHWRATARHGRPFIRIHEADARRDVEVILDPTPRSKEKQDLEEAEMNIRIAGSLVRKFARPGSRISLATPGGYYLTATNGVTAFALLDHLALLDIELTRSQDPPVGRSTHPVMLGPRAGIRGKKDTINGLKHLALH